MNIEERIKELRKQRAWARLRCREIWSTILGLENALKEQRKIYEEWNQKFKEADFELSKLDGRYKVVTKRRVRNYVTKLTPEQLKRIKRKLKEMNLEVD